MAQQNDCCLAVIKQIYPLTAGRGIIVKYTKTPCFNDLVPTKKTGNCAHQKS